MKFTVNGKALAESLEKVGKNVAARVTNPIYHSVHIKATENKVSLITLTDNSITETQIEDVTVVATGTISLNFKKFLAIVKKNKAYDLTIENNTNENNTNSVDIIFDGSTMNIAATESENFAEPKIYEKGSLLPVLSLPWKEFKTLTTNAAISALKQESHPVLKAAQWKAINGRLSIVTTDGHRLFRTEYDVPTPDFESLPNAVELKKFAGIKGQENVEIFYDKIDKGLVIKGTDAQMYIRSVDGNYPETSRLIPDIDNPTIALTIKKSDFLKANERGGFIVKNERSPYVKLNVANNSVHLDAVTNTDNSSISTNLKPSELTGKDMDIAYNPEYLLDALSQVDEEEITVSLFGVFRPFVIKGKNNPNTTILVTPVRTF